MIRAFSSVPNLGRDEIVGICEQCSKPLIHAMIIYDTVNRDPCNGFFVLYVILIYILWLLLIRV